MGATGLDGRTQCKLSIAKYPLPIANGGLPDAAQSAIING
jgi:hypothetical protein